MPDLSSVVDAHKLSLSWLPWRGPTNCARVGFHSKPQQIAAKCRSLHTHLHAIAAPRAATEKKMFKKFDPAEAVSSRSQVKSSVVRGIRAALVEQYPLIEDVIDEILPKKDISMAKCQNHVNILCAAQEPLFFQQRDGPWYPTLRVLHQYPFIMPKMQVDRGAIKFVLKGANIL